MAGRPYLVMPCRSCRRFMLLTGVSLCLIATALMLASVPEIIRLLHRDEKQVFTPQISRCSHGERIALAREWNMTEKSHRDLLDDRFTCVINRDASIASQRPHKLCLTLLTRRRIALSASHRPKELQRTLDMLLGDEVPSLLEIVVIWSNLEEEPPKSFVSSHGVEVRYRKSPRKSLNRKLWNDPSYRTRAVLLYDDDVSFRPADLDFVFQMWRRFGRDRVVGALARCVRANLAGRWQYNRCNSRDKYALVLTNFAFVDVSILDAYNSDFEAVRQMREHVEEHFKCEDIALNFVAAARVTVPDSRAMSVGGPLLVRGSEQDTNLNPSAGMRKQRGYLEAQSECLNRFSQAFGCMPLVDEVARIEYGFQHNACYKSLADKLRA